jgi:hypothetical protein
MSVASLKAAWAGGSVEAGSVARALHAAAADDAMLRPLVGALMGGMRANRAALVGELTAFAADALAALTASPREGGAWRPALRVVERLVDDVLTRRVLLAADEELWWLIWSRAMAAMVAGPLTAMQVDDATMVAHLAAVSLADAPVQAAFTDRLARDTVTWARVVDGAACGLLALLRSDHGFVGVHTVASLAAARALAAALAVGPAPAAAVLWGWVLSPQVAAGTTTLPAALIAAGCPAATAGVLAPFHAEWLASLPTEALLTLLRSVGIACPLTGPAHPAAQTAQVLQMLCHHAESTHVGTRAQAMSTLQNLCHQLATSLKPPSSTSAAAGAGDPAATATSDRAPWAAATPNWLSRDLVHRVVWLALRGWDHTNPLVSTTSPALFEVAIELAQAAQASHVVHEGVAFVLSQVLSLPAASPSRYHALARVIPHLPSAAALLTAHPHLLADTFLLPATAWFSACGHTHTHTIVNVLTRLRCEVEASLGLAPGHVLYSSGGVGQWVWDAPAMLPLAGASGAGGSEPAGKGKKKAKGAGAGAQPVGGAPALEDDAGAIVAAIERWGLGAWRAHERLFAEALRGVVGRGEGARPATADDIVSGGPAAAVQVRSTVRAAAPGDADERLVEGVSVWLLRDAAVAAWAAVWLPVVAAVLLHPSRHVRTRCSTYGVRDLLVQDPATAAALQRLCDSTDASLLAAVAAPEALRHVASRTDWSDEQGDTSASLSDRQAWALVTIARWTRAQGHPVFPGDPVVAPFAPRMLVPWSRLAAWARASDPDTQLVALETAVVSQATTAPLHREEAAALHRFLHLSHWGLLNDGRKRAVKCVSVALDRVLADTVQAGKALAAEYGADMLMSMTSSPGRPAAAAVAVMQSAGVLQEAVDVVTGILAPLVGDLAPGVPLDRVHVALEVCQCVVDALRPPPQLVPEDGPPAIPTFGDEVRAALAERTTHALLTARPVVLGLLNLVAAPFDRVRSGARALLCSLPVSLHTLYVPSAAAGGADVYAAARNRVWSAALLMASSPRDREASGGAELLRWLYHAHPDARPRALRHLLDLAAQQVARFGAAVAGDVGAARDHGAVSPLLDGALPLPHGLLAALHGILLEEEGRRCGWGAAKGKPPAGAPTALSPPARALKPAALEALALARDGLRHALQILAARGESDGSGGSTAAVATTEAVSAQRADGGRQLAMPVSNSAHHLTTVTGHGALTAASLTVGTAGASDALALGGADADESVAELAGAAGAGDDAGGGEDPSGTAGGGDSEQAYVLVVGSWLACREACDLIARAVVATPLQGGGHDGGDLSGEGTFVLSVADVAACGTQLVEAMLALKHIGCIINCGEALQAICARLAGLHTTHPAVAALPVRWIDGLLEHTRRANQFLLRRSAGFAEAFIAIVRGEAQAGVSGRPLLRHAMDALLEVARVGDAPGGNWRSRVHALNILRLLLSDNVVGVAAMSDLPECVELAVAGFTSPVWGVRNSANMLFAAAVDRGVGSGNRNTALTDDAAVSGGEGTGVMWAQFFARFPTLHALLLRQLGVCVDHAAAAGHPHASLQPLLILLTRLRVDATAGDETAGGEAPTHPTAPFLPLLHRCLAATHVTAREAAAAIILALTPLTSRAGLLERAAGVVHSATAADLNAAHGWLLVARGALRAASTTALLAGASSSVAKVAAAAVSRTVDWSPVPLLGALAVEVAAEGASLLQEGGVDAGTLTAAVHARCEELLSAPTEPRPLPAIAAAALCVAGASPVRRVALLQHELVDVRRAAAVAAARSPSADVMPLLVACAAEDHVDVRSSLAQAAVGGWGVAPQPARADLAAQTLFWATLVAAMDRRNDVTAACNLLHLAAEAWRTSHGSGGAAAARVRWHVVTGELVGHIATASTAWSSYELRRAAGRALAASRMLDSGLEAGTLQTAAAALLGLLHDVDDEVRDAARSAAQGLLAAALDAGKLPAVGAAIAPAAVPGGPAASLVASSVVEVVRGGVVQCDVMDRLAAPAALLALAALAGVDAAGGAARVAHAALLSLAAPVDDNTVPTSAPLPPTATVTAAGVMVTTPGGGLAQRPLFCADRVNTFAAPWAVALALRDAADAAAALGAGHMATAFRVVTAALAPAPAARVAATDGELHVWVRRSDVVLGDGLLGSEAGTIAQRLAACADGT